MDLRSFSPRNQGCLFELQQLLDAVPLERVVFLIDESTDRSFLEDALQRAWQRSRADSPNRTSKAASARLVLLRRHGARGVRGLIKLLSDVRTASAGHVLETAHGAAARSA
jgi:hypothetical protein